MPTILKWGDAVLLPTPPDSTWTDVDLDTYGAPSDVAGAIIACVRINSGDTTEGKDVGARCNGSTDTGGSFLDFNEGTSSSNSRLKYNIVGCDANHLIEIYLRANPAVSMYIYGWLHEHEFVGYTNGSGVSGTLSTSYNTFGPSSPPADTVQAWVLGYSNTHWGAMHLNIRPVGSSYANKAMKTQFSTAGDVIAPADGAMQWQMQGDEEFAKQYFYLRGYFKSGVNLIGNSPTEFTNSSNDQDQRHTVAAADAESVIFCYHYDNASGSRTLLTHTSENQSDTPYNGYNIPTHFWCPQFVQLDVNKQFDLIGRYSGAEIVGLWFWFESGPTAVPPTSYPAIEDIYGEYLSRDFSPGWTDHDPSGFAGANVPHGVVVDSSGTATGHPHPEVTDTTYGLDFDNGYIATPFGPTTGEAWGFSCRIFVPSDYTDHVDIAGVDGSHYFRIENTDPPRLAIHWGNYLSINAATFDTDAWNDLYVYMPASGSPYGETQNGSGNGPTMTGAVSADLAIGNYAAAGGSREFRGRITDFKIFTGNPRQSGSKLVHYYPIHDNSNTIVDMMQTGNATLTAGNSTWSDQPPPGGAVPEYEFVFTGNTMLEMPDIVPKNSENSWTLEFEFLLTDLNANHVLIGCDDNGWVPWWMIASSGGFSMVYFASALSPHDYVHGLSTGTWYKLEIYWPGNGGVQRLRVNDGTAVNGDNRGSYNNTNNRPLMLGNAHRAWSDDPNTMFRGRMKNLKVYGGNNIDGTGTLYGDFPMNDNQFPMQDISQSGYLPNGITVYQLGSGYWEEVSS